MATGKLCGVEALARWNHPDKGLIQPYYFISLAEANGLIEDLTWLMLDQTAKDWCALNIDATASINLTASMFKDLSLPSKISNIINKYQLDSSQIILEVTESALIEELAKSLECLTRLRMKGFQLSIDDFGTGHSSLIQLHRIPFSELKIDRSFIMKMTKDQEARAIVETVIILSHKLKMRSVAEGIEDESVLDALKNAGCDIAQGYHFAKPMPFDNLKAWIKDRGQLNT